MGADFAPSRGSDEKKLPPDAGLFLAFELAVDGAADRSTAGWFATGAPWRYDAQHYEGVLAVRRREADIMRSYVRGERCLMQLLTASLDDPLTQPCGRCSVCLAGATEWTASVDDETVRTVTRALRGASTVLEPRKMWPGGAFGRRGRIPPDEMAQPGRVLAHADAPSARSLRKPVDDVLTFLEP